MRCACRLRTMRQLVALPRQGGRSLDLSGMETRDAYERDRRGFAARFGLHAELDDMRSDDLRDSLLLYTPECRGSAPTIEGLPSVGDVDAVAREAAERVANRIAANVL